MSVSTLYPTTSPSLLLDFANVKALDPRITFTRASTAAYYDGVTTAKAEENLFQQSNSMNSGGWSTVGATLGGSVTAPDGTNSATELTLVTDDNSRLSYTLPVVSGLDYTFSVWMRIASGSVSVRIGAIRSGTYESKTVTTTWTRFSITSTANTTGNRYPQITRDGTDTTIEVWGAQLEIRSTATSYTPTTTQPITNYIPVLQSAASGVARFDHNPTTGESLGLLVEEQRTNLYTSSAILKAGGFKIIYSDGPTSPTGDLFVLGQSDTTSGEHYFADRSFIPTLSTTYAFSVYAKQGPGNYLLHLRVASGNIGASNFNLQTGTASAPSGVASSTIITPVGNGVYRCTMVWTATSATSTVVRLQLLTNAGAGTFTGDGWSGIFVSGAQLEAGAFPTSYIPTAGATVTRAADAASMTGTNFSSWYRQDEGTLFAEVQASANANTVYASTSNGTVNQNSISFDNAGGDIRNVVYYNSSAVAVINLSSVGTTGSFVKLAAGYKANDFAAVRNAGAVGTDTTGNVPLNVSQFDIGRNPNVIASTYVSGTIKKLAYYPQRLTNAQLQALTA